jgi:hypothetical protein
MEIGLCIDEDETFCFIGTFSIESADGGRTMIVHNIRCLFCLVAVLAGLSPIVVFSMTQKTKTFKSSTRPQSPPYSVSVTASTSTPSDDKPHCFKADPRRSLTFDIRVKGLTAARAAVEIISLDQMKFIMGQSHTSDATPNMEIEDSVSTPITKGVAKVSFAGESAESIHLGPGPGAGDWVPKSGTYSNVALITISAGTKGGKQNDAVYKYVYTYQAWTNNPSECTPNVWPQ